MSQPSPADTYLVGGAALPVDEAPSDFQYDTARKFQADAVNWVQDGKVPVGVLAAPTGGGKTAVIASLAEHSNRILCLYPTNALTEMQAETLRTEFDLSVDVVNGRTLEAHGIERSQELMSYARDPARAEVIITNPDVLQAILHNRYFSPGSELLRFFANFDAAVYDEFHYYDPLAASGLLMQMKVLSERGRYQGLEGDHQYPRILLSSATPSQTFVDFVELDLDLAVRHLRSTLVPLDVEDGGPEPDTTLAYDGENVSSEFLTPSSDTKMFDSSGDRTVAEETTGEVPSDCDRFRYPMRVNRWKEDVERAFEIITAALRSGAGLTAADAPTGRAAVIFNSAALSNRYHQYLLSETDLGRFAEKDNGYDTGSDRERQEDFAILNTTSKGEVGLDFDLNRLVMVAPFTAGDFVQRIGRAARHSPAIVDVFGLDDPLWPPIQSYPAFLGRVSNCLGDPDLHRHRLRDLLGLRAARAVKQRTDQNIYHSDDMYEDFGDFPGYRRWSAFLESIDNALELATSTTDPFAPTLDRPTSKVLASVQAALGGLDTLRGRSVEQKIQYPFGDGTVGTEYDLVTALRHYPIEVVRGDEVVLGQGEPGPRIGHYPGNPSEGRGVDLGHSRYAIDQELRSTLQSHVSAATWDATDLRSDDVERFLDVVSLGTAMVPETIETGRTVFVCSEDGEVQKIEEGSKV